MDDKFLELAMGFICTRKADKKGAKLSACVLQDRRDIFMNLDFLYFAVFTDHILI